MTAVLLSHHVDEEDEVCQDDFKESTPALREFVARRPILGVSIMFHHIMKPQNSFIFVLIILQRVDYAHEAIPRSNLRVYLRMSN